MDPNVLLVVMDSVRARNTSVHGHANRTTPFLEEFGSTRATTYTQARAPGARSITSHASIFTGLALEEHMVTSADHKLRPGTTIFEQLQDEGYETGVFSENVWITNVDIGLKRGFDQVVGPQAVPFPDAVNPRKFVAEEGPGQYRKFLREAMDSDQPVQSLANGVYTKFSSDFLQYLPGGSDVGSPGNLYRDRFLDWLDGMDGPWAACINFMDAHGPFQPKPEFDKWGDEQLRALEKESPKTWELHAGTAQWWRQKAREALYDGAILQTDNYIEDVIEALEQRGELEDTLVVVTADHGEGFGEHSNIRNARVAGHNTAVHETVLHVPLIVKFPSQDEGETVEEVAAVAQFPDAVHAVRDGEDGRDAFVPDDYAIATTYGLSEDDQLRGRAQRYIDDTSEFEGRSRAVFETAENGEVNKYITWKDRAATVRVRDAQTSYKTGTEGADRVAEAFADVEDAGVRADAGGMDDVDSTTYDRLEDLGYV